MERSSIYKGRLKKRNQTEWTNYLLEKSQRKKETEKNSREFKFSPKEKRSLT